MPLLFTKNYFHIHRKALYIHKLLPCFSLNFIISFPNQSVFFLLRRQPMNLYRFFLSYRNPYFSASLLICFLKIWAICIFFSLYFIWYSTKILFIFLIYWTRKLIITALLSALYADRIPPTYYSITYNYNPFSTTKFFLLTKDYF